MKNTIVSQIRKIKSHIVASEKMLADGDSNQVNLIAINKAMLVELVAKKAVMDAAYKAKYG